MSKAVQLSKFKFAFDPLHDRIPILAAPSTTLTSKTRNKIMFQKPLAGAAVTNPTDSPTLLLTKHQQKSDGTFSAVNKWHSPIVHAKKGLSLEP